MIGYDVIVVGAGPAGSVAAAALASRGYRTALLDRAAFPRDKPCGDYCDPGSVRLLNALGIVDDLGTQGVGFIDGMMIVAQDGTPLYARYPGGQAMMTPRRRLDLALVERAARCGADLLERFKVDRVAIDEQVSVGGPERGRMLQGRLLVAADGMRSIVARRLGLRTALPSGRYTVGAYFSGVPGPAAGELHLGSGFYGGVARFGDGTANVCFALPREWFRGRQADGAFAAAVGSLPGLRDVLPEWTRETPYRVTGPVGIASHPVLTARTLLAGDAALQVEPITGQGIYFALESGRLAAEEGAAALDTGTFEAAGLRRYARRRARLFGRKIRLLGIVSTLAQRAGAAPYLLRRLRRNPAAARLLLGATGDVLPPGAVLSLPYLIRLLVAAHAYDA